MVILVLLGAGCAATPSPSPGEDDWVRMKSGEWLKGDIKALGIDPDTVNVMGGGTGCVLAKMPALYKNSKISIISNVLRQESLELINAFFSDPENTYWQNSLPADYTLSQQ